MAFGLPSSSHLRQMACDQPVEVGRRRGVFAGELAGRDRVARVAQGHDLAVEMAGGEPFGHVLGQRPAEQAHPVESDGTAVAAVRRGREEEELAAALAPDRDDLRQAVGRGMVGLVDEQGLAGKVVGQVLGGQPVQGRVGAGKGMVQRPGLAKVMRGSASPSRAGSCRDAQDDLFGHFDRRDGHARRGGPGHPLVIAMDKARARFAPAARRSPHG